MVRLTVTAFGEIIVKKAEHSILELLRAFRTHDFFTNDFILPRELRRLTGHSRLLYDEVNGGIFLFVKCDGYFRLYFHVNRTDVKLPTYEVPLTSYVVYRENPDVKQVEWLIKNGFEYENTIIQLSAESLNIVTCDVENVCLITPEEADAFFEKYFPKINMDSGGDETNLAVRESNGELLGIIRYVGRSVKLLAVSDEARSRGTAQKLFSAFVNNTNDLTGRYKLCVVDGNIAALKLYEKLGYKPDGLRSDLYIRRI